MAEEVAFHIGAQVRCKDGLCGTLQNVVVDPATARITDLVVEKGLLLTTDRVLPAHTIQEVDGEHIVLSVGREALNDYPEFRDIAFEPAPDDLQGEQYSAGEALVWVSTWDPYYMLPAVPLIRRHIHQGLSPESVAIGRGSSVNNAGGRIGEIDHVLVNPETGRITFVVVDPGIAQYSLVVPISMVQTVTEDGILLAATDEQLAQLHRYACPSDPDLVADLRASLTNLFSGLRDMEVAVERGVARLTGTVPDAQAKRQAEVIVRASPGVVHVENMLSTDTAIGARVTAALASDPRTDLAIIDVTSDRAMVSLTGSVDSELIRQAAEEIAHQQAGVIAVVNGLEVAPDENSPALRFRSVVLPPEIGSGMTSTS